VMDSKKLDQDRNLRLLEFLQCLFTYFKNLKIREYRNSLRKDLL
jgi:hypothetical protein